MSDPIEVEVMLRTEDAKKPENSWPDAGWDIFCVADENTRQYDGRPGYVLDVGETYTFKTGISMSIPEGYVALLWDRSGMGAKKKVHRLAGVIDCNYRGEWLVCLTNLSLIEQFIGVGDKIIQAIFQEVVKVNMTQVEELDQTERGEKGFASSGW